MTTATMISTAERASLDARLDELRAEETKIHQRLLDLEKWAGRSCVPNLESIRRVSLMNGATPEEAQARANWEDRGWLKAELARLREDIRFLAQRRDECDLAVGKAAAEVVAPELAAALGDLARSVAAVRRAADRLGGIQRRLTTAGYVRTFDLPKLSFLSPILCRGSDADEFLGRHLPQQEGE